MSERALEQRIAAVREHVAPRWDEARAQHLAERAEARQRRRRLTRGAAVVMVAAAAALVYAWPSSPPVATAPSIPAAVPSIAPEGTMRFADGSLVVPLEEGTEWVIDAVQARAIELELAEGAARFEVTPGLPRAFRVRAAHVTVSVVGTVFVVRRHERADGRVDVEVEVDDGTVRVDAMDAAVELHAGERRTFADPGLAEPSESTEARGAGAAARGATETPTGASLARAPRPPAEARTEVAPEEPPREATWRALADEGRFDEGYALLLADRDTLRTGDLETLMVAADCARLSGHPSESLAYLSRALEVGAGDPRAGMVSFTMGRVLLGPLHRPADAAARFSAARELAPEGSLASDALAREVEAWAASGDATRARERAEEYLARYPEGVHARAVRRHGGLE